MVPLDFIVPLALMLLVLVVLWRTQVSDIEQQDRNTLIKLRKTRGAPMEKQIVFPDVSKLPSDQTPAVDVTKLATITDEFKSFRLHHKLDEKKQIQAVERATKLRRPHPMLLSLTKNIVDPKELFNIIRTDPELVAKVLKIVNSPLFALRKPITTINHAVIFLGVSQVKNIALQFILQQNAHFSSEKQKLAYQKIWSASFVASSLSVLLAKEMKMPDVAQMSTLCLLQYLGDIAVLSAHPELAKFYLDGSSTYTRVKAVQEKIGTHPAKLGALLAQKWQLPGDISQNISESLLPMTNQLGEHLLNIDKSQEMIFCYYACRLADLIVFEENSDMLNFEGLKFEQVGKLEFYYAQEQIEKVRLEALHDALCARQFKHKAAQLIAQFAATQ